MWTRFKTKVSTMWRRFKVWAYGILVALGLVVAITADAVIVDFTYVRAVAYDDGTAMPLAEIQSTQLYCNGALVVSELGADEGFSPELVPGDYTCYATHTDIFGRESIPSNEVTKQVLPGLPNPPVLNQD